MYIAHIFILIHYKCNQLIVPFTAGNTLAHIILIHFYTAGIYRFTYIL